MLHAVILEGPRGTTAGGRLSVCLCVPVRPPSVCAREVRLEKLTSGVEEENMGPLEATIRNLSKGIASVLQLPCLRSVLNPVLPSPDPVSPCTTHARLSTSADVAGSWLLVCVVW